MQPDELLSFAHELADAAGISLLRHFRRPLTPERKADASPVTIADRQAEEAMRALIHIRFPRHGIYGEEGERVNPEAPLQWVLDPIDGTRAYMAGYPTFTTLIALCDKGVPVLGIIDQPFLKERWTGAPGHPTLFNGKPARTAPSVELAQATLATTSTDYFTPAEREAFAAISAQALSTLHGGDAYAYAMLASGNLHAVADAALKPYDFCALSPIIEGAGGTITDWRGQPLTLESDGRVLAACNTELHKAALAMVANA